MPDTRSNLDTGVEYRTPAELAALADEVRTDSHATIADHLDVSKSSVSLALSQPSTRRIKMICRILSLYDIEAEPTPKYPVERR